MTDAQRADIGMSGGDNGDRVRQVRLLAIAVTVAIAALIASVVISLLVLEQRQRDLERITAQQDRIIQQQEVTFCEGALQTRSLFARVLSALANRADDTPEDDERQQRQADAVLPELRDLPENCRRHVDPSDIDIDVGWAWTGPPLQGVHNRWYGSRTIPRIPR